MELLIVIGLLTFVGGFTLIVSMDNYRGYNFRADRDLLVSVIQKARSQAMNNMCFGASCTDGKPHGVHIAGNTYTIFQGASWATRDSAIDEVLLPQGKSLAVSGITDIVFSELAGTASVLPAGASTIQLTDTAGKDSSTISITPEGRICWDDLSC